MINDIIIEKNGNFLLDLTSEKNPIINVKKNVNITIDLLINEDTNLLTFFVQKYAKAMLRIFYKNSSEKLEILANLDEFSSFDAVFADFSRKNTSIKSNVILYGDGANSSFKFATLAKENSIKKYNISFDHIGNKTSSNLEGYLVCENEAFVSINGISHIEKNSIKSKANQKIKGILFDEKSKATANPILKIDCDDIEASHACSIGNLNENHIFYLMSRGISEDEARKLIVEGYLNPISAYFDEQNASEISEKIKGEL